MLYPLKLIPTKQINYRLTYCPYSAGNTKLQSNFHNYSWFDSYLFKRYQVSGFGNVSECGIMAPHSNHKTEVACQDA